MVRVFVFFLNPAFAKFALFLDFGDASIRNQKAAVSQDALPT
jgi:hypothetical protein